MPADSASLAVLGAIYALLSADATLVSLVGGANRITSGVPEGQHFPKYVLIGESSEIPDDTLGGFGHDELLTIHTHVEDTQHTIGWKPALDISARVVALLHGATLAVANHAAIYCTLASKDRFDDGPWRRVVTDFRIVTQDT